MWLYEQMKLWVEFEMSLPPHIVTNSQVIYFLKQKDESWVPATPQNFEVKTIMQPLRWL